MRAFAADAQPVPVALRLGDGTCTIRAVDPVRLARTQAALEAEAARLPGVAARLMQDAASARFAVAREQVPAYSAWAYDWVQSYVTSYRVLWRLGKGLAGSVADEAPVLERIGQEISEPMRQAFRERVLAPTEVDGRLADDLEHAGHIVDAAWAAALAGAGVLLATGSPVLASPVVPGLAMAVTARFDLAAAGVPMTPALVALAPDDPLDLVIGDGSEPPAIFLRSMRPMAARMGAVAVRASEAGSLIAAGGTFGFAVGGAPGVAVGVAGGVGLSWGIDWLLNRIDAALNRTEFEAQALAAIATAETRIAGQSGIATATALSARLVAMRAGAGPCG
ncbi:hypothetical protein ACQW02_10485 [Humitalea sp. 24SJ18S-53]|uniref:hypothetical protein n=1 Tax=Humitalea sp. 24SJ18S-53 TaxID=3422307 RepID=UPI003D66AA98